MINLTPTLPILYGTTPGIVLHHYPAGNDRESWTLYVGGEHITVRRAGDGWERVDEDGGGWLTTWEPCPPVVVNLEARTGFLLALDEAERRGLHLDYAAARSLDWWERGRERMIADLARAFRDSAPDVAKEKK